ncbi:MAG: hypothetical protein WCO25_03120 [Candidatus Uhrbacteria bacterium]
MSQRLSAIRTLLAAQPGLATDDDRTAWLNQESYLLNGSVGPSDWSLLLDGLSRRMSTSRRIARTDAWFAVASALAAAFPEDTDDSLLGISLCAQAHAVGMRYEDVESYVRLIDGFRALFLEWANLQSGPAARDARQRDGDDDEENLENTLFDFVCDRLQEFETAMQYETEEDDDGDEPLASDHVDDPEVVVGASALLWDAIEDHIDEVREENDDDEADSDDIASFVLSVGHYLWACHHAKRQRIGRPELTAFVCQYAEDWRELMEDLLRFDLLRPGVLEAFAETRGLATEVIERGVDLMIEYQGLRTDMTPTEYMDCRLAAVEQNA